MTLSIDYAAVSPQYEEHEDNDFCRCLERIDLRFQQEYLQQRGELPASLHPYFLPEVKITQRLRFPYGRPAWSEMPEGRLPGCDEALTQRLQMLMTAFDLTSLERDILLAALLPRLSDHYALLPESGFADGVSQPLLGRLFSTSQLEYRFLLSALHPASRLFQFQLLSEGKLGLNGKSSPIYTVNESVWHFFCGNGSSVMYRHPYVRRAETDNLAWYPASFGEKISSLCLHPDGDTLPVVMLEGQELGGRKQALANILADDNRPVLCVDAESLLSQPDVQQQNSMIGIIRDALLDNAALVLEKGGELATEKNAVIGVLDRLLPLVRLPVFVLHDASASAPVFSHLASVHLSMPQITTSERMSMLQMAWPGDLDADDKSALQNLVARYAFDPADLSLLMREADYYRQIREQNAPFSVGDLQQTLARRSRKNFGKLAQRITPVRTFDDIVLSTVLKKQLGELLATIRLRESVTEKHFGHKTGGKTGLSALFYGDSGTGKTLAAEVLAHHLGVDLIKVDLSAVVNKYIGETEKNLSRIFDLAQADSGVLFFDEADALFGKRSETKDSKDRHANIEVSYLLQRLESYPGLVILATNNRSHLDSAFNRRFTFITRFTYPDVELRTQMWQSIWPSTLTLAEDVDFAALAAGSELTGANIRNVALLAAVLAAEEGSGKIRLHHIERAVSRELGKLGRLPR
ncbi:ATP-binding protein [Serratia sp. 2723]|uniref:ATP-binding protein n=1 Tax=unclassified Serratia (in: enterobacteria) TaxID=2647522 RepID=UPI003D208072